MLIGEGPLLEKHSRQGNEGQEGFNNLIITEKLMFLIFLPISVFSLFISFYLYNTKSPAIEYSKEYSNICQIGNICEFVIEIKKKMKYPITVMYQLTNFYQNHMKSALSRSDDQLLGKYVSFDGMKNCFPYRSLNDDPDQDKWILPCGLESLTFFNDTFDIVGMDIDSRKLQETGIKVKPLNSHYRGFSKQYENQQMMERFSMWMDTAAFSNFKKTYGVIKGDGEYLQPGNLTVYIMNYYNESVFGGTKSIILTTQGESETAAAYLSVAFAVFGVLLIVGLTLIFFMKKKSNISSPRKRLMR